MDCIIETVCGSSWPLLKPVWWQNFELFSKPSKFLSCEEREIISMLPADKSRHSSVSLVTYLFGNAPLSPFIHKKKKNLNFTLLSSHWLFIIDVVFWSSSRFARHNLEEDSLSASWTDSVTFHWHHRWIVYDNPWTKVQRSKNSFNCLPPIRPLFGDWAIMNYEGKQEIALTHSFFSLTHNPGLLTFLSD